MLVTKGMPRGHLAAIAISYALLLGTSLYLAMTSAGGAAGTLGFTIIMLVIIPILLAESAKSPANTVELPERRIRIETAMAPDAVFVNLAQLKFGKVKPHDVDADRRVVVLSSPVAGMSYGFFYPMFVRGAGAGSIVEVGITPKSIECRPRVEKALEICAAEVKKALAA
jgi:hypothetical protein